MNKIAGRLMLSSEEKIEMTLEQLILFLENLQRLTLEKLLVKKQACFNGFLYHVSTSNMINYLSVEIYNISEIVESLKSKNIPFET